MPSTPPDSVAMPAGHPLGPVFIRSAASSGPGVRRRAAVVFVLCALLLGIARWLEPNPAGTGTHTQLGQPKCSWLANWHLPCPTCGMTTAFAYTVRGRWPAAFRAQPTGWLLALVALLALLRSVWELATGRAWRINWYRVPPVRVLLAGSALAAAAWGYKILVTRSQMM